MSGQQLSVEDQAELAALERRVRETDGVALKLEWGMIRQGRLIAALTHHVDGALVAYLGLYGHFPPEVELTGLVDPDHRRQGIATRMLDEARELCTRAGFTRRLLVVPRDSVAGNALVRMRGGVLQHSEYSMRMDRAPRPGPADPRTTLRPATEADRSDRERLLVAGFGDAPAGLLVLDPREGVEQLMIEHDGAVAGVIRLSLHDGTGFIHGFTIDPRLRGRGIGREVLIQAARRLTEHGAGPIGLEVAVENDAALGLYTAVGFRPISTEDYVLLG